MPVTHRQVASIRTARRLRMPGFLVMLALTLALAGGGKAFAIEYLVEVIVLENSRGGAGSSAQSLYLPRIHNAFRLNGDKARAAGFIPVEDDLALLEDAQKIIQSSRYRVLRHFAWRQPGLDNESARAIRVNIGSSFKLHIPQQYTEFDTFIPASATPAPDGSSRELSSTVVSGTLKVRLGRFLHLDTLLAFTDTNTGVTYRLNNSRKMRSRELHYIDNPRFGLLVRIRPIEE